MWVWFQSNAQVVSAVASLAMLGVWAAYLQLIYSSYRRSRRSKILINRGAGTTLDASCIVSNMSAEPIYLEAVRLMLDGEDDQIVSLSDLDISLPAGGDRRPQWLQGPLGSSEMIELGSFRSLIERGFGGNSPGGRNDLEGRSLTIVVVATLTSEDRLVAATRRFRIQGNAQTPRLRPYALRTDQIRSGQARREIEDVLQKELQQEWTNAE